ncbi:MAG: hypothetical protein LBI10_08320 [Deltaproteobacteria bacterium]|jgi:hypothetical protein|nr:hypothetical protein [Deltaproteobacteria bacterium]
MSNRPLAPKKNLLAETLDACRERLEMDRGFVAKLERQIAEPNLDPLDPALWENFIAARRDLFDFTALNLNLLVKKKASGKDLSLLDDQERQIHEDLLTSLSEIAALEEKLTTYLEKNLGVLKETIDKMAKGQAIFAGYAVLDAKPPAIHLDSRA